MFRGNELQHDDVPKFHVSVAPVRPLFCVSVFQLLSKYITAKVDVRATVSQEVLNGTVRQ